MVGDNGRQRYKISAQQRGLRSPFLVVGGMETGKKTEKDKSNPFWKDNELVVIVGFAAQMIATNNFNSVFQIDIDSRLLPIKDEFKPATWRATQA